MGSRVVLCRLRADAEPHPFVVVRYLPGIFGVKAVRVVQRPDEPVPTPAPMPRFRFSWGAGLVRLPDASPPTPSADFFFIVLADDAITDGRIPDATRERIIAAVAAECRRDGLRRCAVFGPGDCAYVNADGTGFRSKNPPSGGLRFDSLLVQRRDATDGRGSR